MRKKVLGLMMAALAISTIGASAQTETTPVAPIKKECCKEKKEYTKEKKELCPVKEGKKEISKDVKKHVVRDAAKPRFNPFEGIELTPDQQQKLDKLKAERKSRNEANKKATQEQMKQEQEEYTNSVISILTPEQATIYKANIEKRKAKAHDRLKEKGKHVKRMNTKGVAVEAAVQQSEEK